MPLTSRSVSPISSQSLAAVPGTAPLSVLPSAGLNPADLSSDIILGDGLLHAEVFSLDQLIRHAKALGAWHRVDRGQGANPLLARLEDNEERLELVFTGLRRTGDAVVPAGVWLLDNQHLIAEQVATARRHLPRRYSHELPRLIAGELVGAPRVYALAIELISHTDSRADEDSVVAFIGAYQEVTSLTLGELWAVPTMLRLALLENLRRIAVRVERCEAQRAAAAAWVQRLVRIADSSPSALVIELGELARLEIPGSAFVANLHRGLQGQNPSLALVLNWLEQRLGERHQTIADSLRTDHQAQAADQLAVENAITSLRRMGTIDWRAFVEGLSPVEKTLRRDPRGIYPTMDFATRDSYRHAVEGLARRCRPAGATAELAVAQTVIGLCLPTPGGPPTDHVGWWLVDGGRQELEQYLDRNLELLRPGHGGTKPPSLGWILAPLTIVTGLGAAAASWVGGPVLGVLAVVPASQVGLGLIHWLATRLVGPRLLPRLELADGIPTGLATLVAVPAMLRYGADVETLCEGLLVRHLANLDPGLGFALLTDFTDAPEEQLPGDALLVAQVVNRIAAMNARHGDRFVVLHRPRQWNAKEGAWLGRERKRGKIEDLNHLLLTGEDAAFSLVAGAVTRLVGVRYVIVLDTDTRLPRDTARGLVATLAHPLNQARHDPATGLVIGGHGLLQPRTAIGLASARKSWFATCWSGDAGIDPYTRAVSDVYQDLFQAGSYIGKGIYDLAAFSRAVDGRFPGDAVLSHDLLEGCYARSALASDLLLVEDHPQGYLGDIARRRRWIRGDWQLLPWLGRRVPSPAGPVANPLDGLSRWKLVDNLRRSLVAPATLALLITAWLATTPEMVGWVTLAVVASRLLPSVLGTLGAIRPGPEIPWIAHLRRILGDGAQGAAIALYDLVVLPYEAAITVDAIGRTCWRMAVSHRHLLEWRTSSETEARPAERLTEVYRTMAIAPLAGLVAILLGEFQPESAPAILPFALAWILAPLIAWNLSRRRTGGSPRLDNRDKAQVLRTARLTWQYFAEQCAQPLQPLPPDNVQDLPVPAVARRTSPTNIGLALLGELAAQDLGWQTSEAMLGRIERILTATLALERHRGHLYNWYSTEDGRPLLPRYVSMVDSGNLAGHLLILAAGLRELALGLPGATQRLAGVRATLACAGTSEALALAGSRADLAQLATAANSLALQDSGETGRWCRRASDEATAHIAELASRNLPALTLQANRLADQATTLALGMEWDFLLDPRAKLFAIGWQVEEARLDRSSYDLLASESRLGSFVAVAAGGISQEHWFRLGRQQVRCAGGQALVSWSGTLFEYLMPALVMPEEPGTLLEASNRAAVAEQRHYAELRGVPWGISESAYHLTDAHLNWQYRAFGVPGLGIKRGLADDLVIAPYASALALLVDAPAVAANFRRLTALGAEGRYGFYDAIDFTAARLPQGTSHAVIPSWMVHHQGMTLLACLHVLAGAPMRRRFLADPRLLAHRLLLQERPTPAAAPPPALEETTEIRSGEEPGLRVIGEPHPQMPEVHLLSNGRWHLLITASGAGQSRCQDVAINRWREDPTCDGGGHVVYLRDAADGRLWSTTAQPMGPCPTPGSGSCEAIFTQARAEFRRLEHGIAAHTEIAISPEDDVELRRLTLANRTGVERILELTTYSEPVLAPHLADLSHPSFSNLFIETEHLAGSGALVASRRPRRPSEARYWLIHLLVVRQGDELGILSWETDRRAFIGRGRTTTLPTALAGTIGTPLAGGLGAVLDPALALRRLVRVPPRGRVVVDVVYGLAATREAAIALADRYRDEHLADRILGLAWTHGQVVLAQLGANEAEAQVFGRLAGALVLPTVHRRAPVEILRNRRTRSGLWSHGISGDLPLMLLRVADSQRLELVRQVLRAHAWWRGCGLAVDLVILIEDPSDYRQELTERVVGLVAAGPAAGQLDRSGGIFVRRADQVPEEDRHLLAAVARLVVSDAAGSLAQYADRRVRSELLASRLEPPRTGRHEQPCAPPAFDLQQWNGLGGFTRDGREYIIVLPPRSCTPLPWCNVLANPEFGSVVSERGAAYTWAGNCHEFRLTPWRCDAVVDPHGEAVYLRDENTGLAWCPTPGPMPGRSVRTVRHGFGYSAFMAGEESIASELHLWVDAVEPVKLLRMRLVNRSGRARRLSAFAWVEWTLGELRERTAPGLVTEHDDGVLYARNPLHDEGSARTAFLTANRRAVSWTCDRGEFLGRGGSAGKPAALSASRLQGRAGAGLDPGAALQFQIELAPGEEYEVVFILGCGRDRGHATALTSLFRSVDAPGQSLERVYAQWKTLLGRVQVQTPDPRFDLLVNGWLAYQAIAARILARSGFSQSGGAWGFRDQLQDAMALVHHDPGLLRAQLLRCAARQFREGDVQHWWHPPLGRGVRTRISDDYLWLPYALARYLDTTGDRSVLDERQPFLDGPPVPPDQESLYDLPTIAEESGTIYTHAKRAVLHALHFGVHGLPLMGSGDWNDGMDRVGHHGRGESVWLGFFLVDVLRRFAPIARRAGDPDLAEHLLGEANHLAGRIDATAWEQDRYLRAWTDDGIALGSASATECRIDALPQAWAALTGACRPERARLAMTSVDRLLVRREEGLIQLFDPPFDKGPVEPGYVKGYLPGVRENGGQYTHAAIWTAMAFAALGDGDRALELTRLIDPIRHGADPAKWQGEPYVMAADVYRSPGQVGRAGWTWYTGSAGWMLRLILESLLGVVRDGGTLGFAPCLPVGFGDYAVTYRVGRACWHIAIHGEGPHVRIQVDDIDQTDGRISLVDDAREHRVEVSRSAGP